MFRSIYPYDQSLIEEFQLTDDKTIAFKLEKAEQAFKEWSYTSFEQRSTLMHKAAHILRLNKEKYAKAITWEMGKVISESRAEVEKCALVCDYYADYAASFLRDEINSIESKRSLVAYQPLGVVFAIMPWNFPFWQVFRFAAPTLMAGNVGLLKHAQNVTRCSLLIESIFTEADFPKGVFQSLVIESGKTEEIIKSNVVKAVTLTGSEYAGSKVAAIAGKYIKKTVLELGGSDPFIVLPDADIEKAAKVAVESRMRNAGQSCIAAKRFIVHKSIKDHFNDSFIKAVKSLRQGDPFKEETTIGPMAKLDLAQNLHNQLQASVKKGANILTGGNHDSCNYQPTVLDNITTTMPVYKEETFGPLAAIITVKDEAEAIAIANASPYGLGASIWTKELERGEQLARKIEAGSVFINSLVRSDPRMPFGGIKNSGYGRELSWHGIREFVNTKTIYVE